MYVNINVPDVNINVPDDRIRDMLIGAFEGGLNYWIDSVKAVVPEGSHKHILERFTKETPDYPPLYLTPFVDGCSIAIVEQDPQAPAKAPNPINMTTMHTALLMMAAKYPRHFADLLSENDDAIDGGCVSAIVRFWRNCLRVIFLLTFSTEYDRIMP